MNSEYWEKRLADVVWNSYNTLEEQNIALLDHYGKTMNNIRAELVKIEEQKTLTRSDKYRVRHLKSIQEQIVKECEKLGDSVENDMIINVTKHMQDIYKASFSNISKKKFSQLSKNACRDIINTPWKGSSFSERLWSNTGKLANELNDILAAGITEGKTISEMAFQLSNRMHNDMNICHRLVRTETINSLNRASMRGMMDAGVGYVRWWAAQDERECDECGANHEKVYPVDRSPNLPCHPGCRCTWLPVFEDELTEADIAEISQFENEPYYLKTEKNHKFSDGTKSLKNPKIRDAIVFVNDENVEFIYPMHYDKSKQKIDPRKAMTIFEELPQEIRKVIKKIEFADYQNPRDHIWKERYGIDDFVSFAVSGDDNNIIFWKNDYLNDETLTDEAIKRTYIHEGGHIVDNGKIYSFDQGWKEAVEKDEEFPTEYGESDIREDFAESVAEFFINNDGFKTKCPNRYKFIKELPVWKKK